MKIQLRLLLIAMILALSAAWVIGCTDEDDPASDGDVIDGDTSDPEGCTPGETKCVGNDVHECNQQQSWQLSQSCSALGSYVCLYGVCQKQGDPDGDSDDTPDGDQTDGDQPDGDQPDGDQPDGDIDGDAPECIEDGDVTDGDAADGDSDDDATDGDSDDEATDADIDDEADDDVEIDGDTDGSEVGASLRSVNNSDCLGTMKDAESVEASWNDSLQSIVAVHHNAIYNCCINKIDVDLGIDGMTLKLYESEDLDAPCDCICPYDVTVMIDGLAPGTYTVEFYKPGDQLAGRAEVIVPAD